MYPTLVSGGGIPCPIFGGRGYHALHFDYETGEVFVHCNHLRQEIRRKTDKVLISTENPVNEAEANELYSAWRDEIFAQAVKYVN